MEYKLELAIQSTDRRSVRNEIVAAWLAEEAGDPVVHHRYRYDVEQFGDGMRIYLQRPTRLNKGMDFVIYCEGFLCWKNGNCKPPSYSNLYSELDAIVDDSGGREDDKRRELARALGRIWRCDKPEPVLADLRLTIGVQAERVLKLARWFFIEQDLTYWTASGRWMLRSGIEDHLGESFDV